MHKVIQTDSLDGNFYFQQNAYAILLFLKLIYSIIGSIQDL